MRVIVMIGLWLSLAMGLGGLMSAITAAASSAFSIAKARPGANENIRAASPKPGRAAAASNSTALPGRPPDGTQVPLITSTCPTCQQSQTRVWVYRHPDWIPLE